MAEPMTFTAARIDRVRVAPGERRTFADGSLCLTVGTRTRRWWTYGRDSAGAQREVTLGQWPGLPHIRDGLATSPHRTQHDLSPGTGGTPYTTGRSLPISTAYRP